MRKMSCLPRVRFAFPYQIVSVYSSVGQVAQSAHRPASSMATNDLKEVEPGFGVWSRH